MTSACGKKTEVKNAEEKNFSPTKSELYFNALRDLRKAIVENKVEAVKKVILENPLIDLNEIQSDGETFLTYSVKNDLRSIRNFLIAKGVSLEKANVNRETPLIAAAAFGRLNSVQILLDLKVEVEKRNTNRDTALLVAIKNSHDEISLSLIKYGAKIDALDRNERTAAQLANENKVPKTQEIIRSLQQLERGAPDLSEYRAVLIEADYAKLTSILTKYPRIANDDIYESINPLALLVAAKNEFSALRSARLLLKNQANADGPKEADVTPLIKATINKKKSFATLFLTSKANPQALDKDGKSALIHAVENNNPEMVEILMNHNALIKYTLRKGGQRLTFSACEIAYKNAKTATEDKARADNLKVRRSLECTFIGKFF